MQAAEALAHAHELGVIHRDIKPWNLLLDLRGNLWITDFGLAQIQSDPGLTLTGDLVGTLRYMSPEQALAKRVPVDHRTDIYSLGATLYELLTLEPVFAGRDRHELLRQIAFDEPRPARRVNPALPHELDTILLKTIAKNPAERYTTAKELADDLRRFLEDKPIRAKPPTLLQCAVKWSRRHSTLVASGVVVLVLAVVGLSFGTLLLLWREQGRTRSALEQAQANATTARDEAERADHEARQARTLARIAKSANQFLCDMLVKADRGEQEGNPGITVCEVMDIAAKELAHGTVEYEPEVEASVRDAIGRTYQALGLYAASEPHLQKALELVRRVHGDQHPNVATSLNNLAELLHKKGDHASADRLLREALGMRESLADDHPEVARSLNNLAELLHDQGDYTAAEPLFREALGMRRRLLGNEHPFVATSVNNLVTLLQAKGDYAAAEPLLRESLAMHRKLLGDEHPNVAISLNNLAALLHKQGDYAAAEPLYREALAMRRKLLGEEHPDTLTSILGLASLLRRQRRIADAELFYREFVEQSPRVLGESHPKTITALNDMGLIVESQGKFTEAEAYYRASLDGGSDATSIRRP